MKTIICYSNKSSVTGKAIAAKLNALRKRTDKKARCDILLRWGSLEGFTRLKTKLELNSREAVGNSVNKLTMLKLLREAGVQTVDYHFDPEMVGNYLDKHGMQYIRSKSGVVRYANDFNPSRDAYYSRPVKYKRREYRVHVFNGKVIGIYEKVPHLAGAENRPKLFKSDTCSFVRCDPEVCRVKPAQQEQCILAVQTLGLLFGGVDLIRDKDGNCFISEVNSAPGLNSQMIEKYIQEITKYYEEEV